MNRLGAGSARSRSASGGVLPSMAASDARSTRSSSGSGESAGASGSGDALDAAFVQALRDAAPLGPVLPFPAAGPGFNDLAQQLGLQDPQEVQAFRAAFAHHMQGLDLGLTPPEAAALDGLTRQITAARLDAPTERGRRAQLLNNTRAATLAWATGFGLVSLIVKLATHTGLGGQAIHLVNLAGPLILLGSEVLAGKYRAEGAGYAAVDSLAYQSHQQNGARLTELGLALNGARAAVPVHPQRVADLQAHIDTLQLANQRILVDLLIRELGVPLRAKSPDAAPDVPLACLRSGLVADAAGRVSTADGKWLFTVVQPLLAGRFDVRWPDGSTTDLMAALALAPAGGQDPLRGAGERLLGAARLRAFVCDETPFLLFGAFYAISGALGPYLLKALDDPKAGAAADTLLSVGMAFFGTQSLVHAQNAARAAWSGKAVGPGAHAPERVARLERAELHRSALVARLAYLKDARTALDRQLADDAIGPPLAADGRAERTAARSGVKRAMVTVMRELRTAELAVSKERSKLGTVAFNTRAGWQGYLADTPLLVSRIVAYTLPYVFYSQVFMQQIQVLYPGDPGPAGNATGDPMAFNASTGAPPGDLGHYMAANAFNGFVMAIPFMFRNLAVSRLLEHGIRLGIGAVRHGHERWWAGPPPAARGAEDDEVVRLGVRGSDPSSASQERLPGSRESLVTDSSSDADASLPGPITFDPDPG